MTAATKILIVGSLPPTRSHAALLTHSLAAAAAQYGIEVVCLIDALAPPPESDLPYTVARPFDPFIQSGQAGNWPRLFVVGSGGDSLPVIETLHTAPGAVIAATHSLFDLSLPWLQTAPDFPENLTTWLSEKYGKPGAVVADALINHRRSSDHLGREIPAYDLLLQTATSHLTLGPLQTARMTDAGFNPTQIGAVPVKLQHADRATDKSPLQILVIGADIETAKTVSQGVASSALTQQLQLTFKDRYSPCCQQALLASDAVAILDGHDSAACPYFELAAFNGIPLITAGQPWTSLLPHGAHIALDHPVSRASLLHAIAAMGTVDGLLSGLEQGLKALGSNQQQPDTWMETLLRAAATATPVNLAKTYPLPQVLAPMLHVKPSPPNSHDPSGIFALIGAVPSPHILQQFYPDLDAGACPRFMTPNIALTAADFMQIPAAQLQDRMGFEAPLIVTEQTAPGAEFGGRKLRRWTEVQPGLRRAKEALTFGCAVPGATQAPTSEASASWPLITAPQDTTSPAVTSSFDVESGVYWSYDPVRGALNCMLLTGGAGHLEFQTSGKTSFVVTNLSSTQIVSSQENGRFTISTDGLGLFKVAILPSGENNENDMLKRLAQDSLHLKWSFL